MAKLAEISNMCFSNPIARPMGKSLFKPATLITPAEDLSDDPLATPETNESSYKFDKVQPTANTTSSNPIEELKIRKNKAQGFYN